MARAEPAWPKFLILFITGRDDGASPPQNNASTSADRARAIAMQRLCKADSAAVDDDN